MGRNCPKFTTRLLKQLLKLLKPPKRRTHGFHLVNMMQEIRMLEVEKLKYSRVISTERVGKESYELFQGE